MLVLDVLVTGASPVSENMSFPDLDPHDAFQVSSDIINARRRSATDLCGKALNLQIKSSWNTSEKGSADELHYSFVVNTGFLPLDVISLNSLALYFQDC